MKSVGFVIVGAFVGVLLSRLPKWIQSSMIPNHKPDDAPILRGLARDGVRHKSPPGASIVARPVTTNQVDVLPPNDVTADQSDALPQTLATAGRRLSAAVGAL